MQLLKLLQKLISAIELAGSKSILRGALYLGDIWAVVWARCGLSQRFLVVSGNLDQFFAQPVNWYLPFTENKKKCLQRAFIDPKILFKCVDFILLIFGTILYV